MTGWLYWLSVTVLVVLLTILSMYLFLRVVQDFCSSSQEAPEVSEQNKLTKYHFERSDVEDLTRFQHDIKTILPNVTITNEVEREDILPELPKHSEDVQSTETMEGQVEETSEFQGIDDLEFWDPQYMDLLKAIVRIESGAKEVEEEMKGFAGSLSDLQYFETNERFINLMICLAEIYCEKEDLRKRKMEVGDYIQSCKDVLRIRYLRSK